MPSLINATTTNGLVTSADNSGSLQLQTNNGTTAVTIDTSQNVGVGTTSPAVKLHVNGSGSIIRVATDTSTSGTIDLSATSTSAVINANTYATAVPLVFQTASTERMRIDNTGNLLINTTTANNPTLSQGFLTVNQTGLKNGMVARINQSGYTVLAAEPVGHNSWFFGYMLNSSGAVIGSISCNSTSTSYVTSSDYRLKENIAPMAGALAKVQALKPVTYTWKNTGEQADGFIAHELAEVLPQAVVGEKDAVDADGKPVYQGVDTSFLVATLTAAIQELKAELDATKAEVQALKGVA